MVVMGAEWSSSQAVCCSCSREEAVIMTQVEDRIEIERADPGEAAEAEAKRRSGVVVVADTINRNSGEVSSITICVV